MSNANGCAIRGSVLPSCVGYPPRAPRAGSASDQNRTYAMLADATGYSGCRGQRLACAVLFYRLATRESRLRT